MAHSGPNRYNRVIVTSGDDTRTPAPLTRRSARASVAPAAAPRPVALASVAPRRAPSARWSRRRGVVAVFGGAAALAFAVASVGPAAFALSAAASTDPEDETVYSSTVDDAQSLVLASGAAVVLDRDSYTAYQTPAPEPVKTSEPVSGVAAITTPYYTGGGAPSEWMAAAGIAESDWGYVDYVVSRESGWNPNATNSSSGACGLVQAYPCSKVPGNGYDPVDNLRWANGYAVGRYGSWAGAYAFWTSNHWW